MIYLILVLFISYSLCVNYSIFGKNYFIALTWIFCILVKITSEIWDGYSIDFLNVSEFLRNPLLGWNGVFGLIMLKIISFNMEFSYVAEKDTKNNYLTSFEKIKEHCKDCNKKKFCLTALKFVYVKEDDFTFLNLLIYIFYPPFYFSGPTIMFHSFIFQVNNYDRNGHNYSFDKNKMIYFIRCICIFITLEIFNHFIFVNAIMTNKYNSWIFEEYRNNNSYFNYFFLAFNNLVFIFLKFSLIWKVARLWGWVDGIYSEENMNRCIYNNYNFEGFWRQWHRSYNVWLIRYMYIPLGGKKKKLLNTFIIFSFVALWHDLKFNLLLWAWTIYISLIPEIIIKSYFNREENQYLNNYMWFRYLKAWFSSVVILLMITANLIGFGIGNKELVDALLNLFKLTTPLRFIQISMFFFPFTFAMFFVRELERINGIKKNF
jgi:D-alanyl-lipoteichoic acid acyltransferase DltB (MBOAT superfamily)